MQYIIAPHRTIDYDPQHPEQSS